MNEECEDEREMFVKKSKKRRHLEITTAHEDTSGNTTVASIDAGIDTDDQEDHNAADPSPYFDVNNSLFWYRAT